MPAFIEDEDQPQDLPEPTLQMADQQYDSPVVDTRKEGYDSLATFYSGSKLPGDYYQMHQRRDSAAASYQADIPVIYGQRRVIRGFELIVDGQLNHKQNTSDTNGFNTTADAVVYGIPGMVPQSGDIFVGQLGSWRNVLFQINNPERLSPFEESGYRVTLKAQKWLDKEGLATLQRSVVETAFFDRENFRNGLKCLLTNEDVDVMKRLERAHRRLMGTYFRDFFDDQFMTFIMPGTREAGTPAYDPNITRFVKRMISVVDMPSIVKVVELGVGDDLYSATPSLVDVILNKDDTLLYSCAQKWNLVDVNNFYSHPLMHGIYYSGVRYVMSPQDPKYRVSTSQMLPYIGVETSKANVLFKDIDYILPALGLHEEETHPDHTRYIKRVLVDNYYIFSKEFYEDEGELSMLESMVLDRLRNRSINLKDLADLAEYAQKFNNLERYYYIPIIINLIKRAPGVL